MIELSEEIIDVMMKVKDAVNHSSFEINSFKVSNSFAGSEIIEIDIRRHEVKDEE